MKTKMKINEDNAHILKMSASEIMEKLKSESDFLSGKFLAMCSIEDVEKNVVISCVLDGFEESVDVCVYLDDMNGANIVNGGVPMDIDKYNGIIINSSTGSENLENTMSKIANRFWKTYLENSNIESFVERSLKSVEEYSCNTWTPNC